MISRKELEDTGKAVEKALADFAKTHNMEIRYHGGQYGTAEGTIKLKFKRAGTVGQEDAKKEWDSHCYPGSSLEPWMFGTQFRIDGQPYKVIGLNQSSRTKTVAIERVSDGRAYKCSPGSLKAYMASSGVSAPAAAPAAPPVGSILRHVI